MRHSVPVCWPLLLREWTMIAELPRALLNFVKRALL